METITIEIPDRLKNFVDRKIQSGSFKNSSDVVQALVDVAICAETRVEIDKKLLHSINQIEGGECAPWDPAEDRMLLQVMIRQRIVDAVN
jgi:Arc/MetJ-type ribon-helix-helix transcriptional regulator